MPPIYLPMNNMPDIRMIITLTTPYTKLLPSSKSDPTSFSQARLQSSATRSQKLTLMLFRYKSYQHVLWLWQPITLPMLCNRIKSYTGQIESSWYTMLIQGMTKFHYLAAPRPTENKRKESDPLVMFLHSAQTICTILMFQHQNVKYVPRRHQCYK